MTPLSQIKIRSLESCTFSLEVKLNAISNYDKHLLLHNPLKVREFVCEEWNNTGLVCNDVTAAMQTTKHTTPPFFLWDLELG